jgi:hypothetical protein
LDKQVWILNFTTEPKVAGVYPPVATFKSATRVALQPYLFEARHYWFPFNTTQTQIYAGFSQNPGW